VLSSSSSVAVAFEAIWLSLTSIRAVAAAFASIPPMNLSNIPSMLFRKDVGLSVSGVSTTAVSLVSSGIVQAPIQRVMCAVSRVEQSATLHASTRPGLRHFENALQHHPHGQATSFPLILFGLKRLVGLLQLGNLRVFAGDRAFERRDLGFEFGDGGYRRCRNAVCLY